MIKDFWDMFVDNGLVSTYEESKGYVEKLIEQIETTPNEELSRTSNFILIMCLKKLVDTLESEGNKIKEEYKQE